MPDHQKENKLIDAIDRARLAMLLILVLVLLIAVIVFNPTLLRSFSKQNVFERKFSNKKESIQWWLPPDTITIYKEPNASEILYGKELITRTSDYLGPKGSVLQMSNGMNCQNCHLSGGRKIYGNNFSAVASTYPKFRARSGTNETIEKRVNDCFERSLNGSTLKTDGDEMKAMVAYIKWVGKGVSRGEVPDGAGLPELSLLNSAAEPLKGKVIYENKCASCHGKNGEGILSEMDSSWKYPPLWGNNSYNDGAGLFRLSRFAGYVKANMPWGATFDQPQLTDEEAWHVAAYVNSMERPKKELSEDWPDISKKPFDYPYGPYTDDFTESQHKYGPFISMVKKK